MDIIESQLADLPPRYNLFNYVTFDGLAVDHLLVTPKGLLVIQSKPHTGAISASHDKWKRKIGVFGYITVFGEPTLGDPSREISNLVKKSHEWFEKERVRVADRRLNRLHLARPAPSIPARSA